MIKYPRNFLFYVFEKTNTYGGYTYNYKRLSDDFEYGLSIADFIDQYPDSAILDAYQILKENKEHTELIKEYIEFLHNKSLSYLEEADEMETYLN
jgi:hypothetical protein